MTKKKLDTRDFIQMEFDMRNFCVKKVKVSQPYKTKYNKLYYKCLIHLPVSFLKYGGEPVLIIPYSKVYTDNKHSNYHRFHKLVKKFMSRWRERKVFREGFS